MTPPPALTWLHLLAADCAFECTGAPEPLRGSLVKRSVPDGRRVLCQWNGPVFASDWDHAASVVLVNPAHIPLNALQSAGFVHLTRLAVLPSLDQPRWFIPLTSPAVSAAAFNLYSPTRLSARLKRAAVKVAVHARAPIWYRDQIVLAQREPSPLERRTRELFPNQDISIALSAGAPEGARNRKVSAAVIARNGQILAFLKLATSSLSESLLRNEARILSEMSARNVARGSIPELLLAESVDGPYVTAQSPLQGRPVASRFTEAHRSLLGDLRIDNRAAAQTDLVIGLRSRIAALDAEEPQLSSALDQALMGLGSMPLPVGVMHGDFAPWNLRFHHGRIRAFDWEYGSMSAPSDLDEIHHRLQVGHLLENWTVERAMHELRDIRQPLLILYLVDMLARLFAEGYDRSNEMLAWLDRMLGTLCAAMPKEAALA